MTASVCIVGGGPAGVVAAVTASAAGAMAVIVTAPNRSRRRRLELLSGRGIRILRSLGLWSGVQQTATPCTGTSSRWSADSFHQRTSMLNPDGEGWIVDRASFDSGLLAAARECGVAIISARVNQVDATHRIAIRDGTIEAGTVVLASGAAANGVLRAEHQRSVRHRMIALAVTLGPSALHGLDGQLLIDRAFNGWWYAMANESRTEAVFCTDAMFLKMGRTSVEQVWREACGDAAEWLSSEAADLTPTVYPATVATTSPAVAERVRLVGDAALSPDPLSGQGLTFAIESGSRCFDEEYEEFVRGHSARCAAMARQTYRSADSAVTTGSFWARRR